MPDPSPKNLAQLIDQHARSRPTHPAVRWRDSEITYAEFARTVRRYASALTADGVRRGSLVGIGLKDHPAHLAMLFAVMRLGAVIVPVDWRWSREETASLARHFGLDALVIEEDAPHIDGPALIRAGAAWQAQAEALSDAAPVAEAEDLPMILSLSSGTTGRPTGPLLTHAQMMARTENQLVTLTFSQHDRYLLATPLYFGGGRAFALTHLMIGATLVLFPPPYGPEDLVAAIRDSGAHSTFLVPTLIRRLLELPDESLGALKNLRLLISSGAPLHPDERLAIERRICPGFIEYFASTEGGGISVMAPAERADRPHSVGRAAFRVDVEIVDADHRPLPAGEVGAVRYRGPGVADGFFRDDETSREAFIDGWFYPGDLGALDAEGYLTLMGRSKNVIIRGGVNIYPLEIERALESHPSVREAAVFALPDPELGEEVCAALVLREPVDEDAVRAYCRTCLAPYKVPSHIDIRDALPRNSGGKVLLDKLRDTALARRGAARS